MTAPRECDECGAHFEADRKTQRFCRAACRAKANARPAKVGKAEAPKVPAQAPVHTAGGLVGAVSAELTKLEQIDSVEGRAALALAYRIESPMETGAAAASMSKQLTELMDRARAAAAPKQRDGVSDLEEGVRAKLSLVSG